ncbi:DNA polymerase alpha accessory factor Mcl1 [Coemansia sp. RSA 552]|nr:DNA polymerase alpha accessory factor Mcl1 [Coemansia sp. RSA 552]
MAPSVTAPRYAHAEGYTTVAFGRDGDFICTGGSDSLVRVFYASKAERDQEAVTLEQHSDNVLSLAVSRNKIVSGDEEGTVFSFDVDAAALASSGRISIEPSGTVLRSTLPARDVSISSSERLVAIATDDESISVVSLLDMAPVHTLTGHRGSVNSVCFSPDAAYLASVGCNGTVRIWDMRGDEPGCVSVMHREAYVCEPGSSAEQSKARWSPDGRLVAVPGPDHSIKLVERGSWTVSAVLGVKHTKMVTHVSWSSNSRYLASVGLDAQVAVWDVAARTAILTHTAAGPLSQVDWNPRGNMLAFTDNTGAMYVWDDVVQPDQGHALPYERQPVDAGGMSRAAQSEPSGAVGIMFNDDETDVPNGDMDIDGAADDDGDVDDVGDATGDGLEDFVVDDDGGGYAERLAPRWTVVGDPQAHAFQPGSTPWAGGRRYLAFTMVGSVVAIAQDASYNSVEIDFYDKSLHRDFHFSDSFKFSMAALSEVGCLFATTTKELANDHSLRGASDDAETSVLSYRAFSSWSANADWLFKLPPKEHPCCIAASSRGAAAVTSLGMLRLFTCGGVQRHVASVPGRVVTCTAHSDMLLLVLEALGSIKSDMGARRVEYEYILLSMDGQTRLAAGCCPVTPSSEIVWAGFSEEGHPATCDSKGMLRILHRYWAGADASWIPVLDTRRLSQERGRREAFWPVALSAKQFVVVTCKSGSRFPPYPRPILDELDIEIPLLNGNSNVGQQEAAHMAARIFSEQQSGEAERTDAEYPGGAMAQARDELEQDKLLLRLIQLACKADKALRAMDLALMIKLERSFDAAIKIAVHQKQASLAERLVRIKDSRFGGDDPEDGDAAADPSSDDEPQPLLPPPGGRRHSRPPVATYGRGSADSSRSGRPSAEDGAGDGEQPASGDEDNENDDGDAEDSPMLVSRPAKPPVTSRPFNPFGAAPPSTSMELKRSDSFFDAADLHGEEPAPAASSGKRPSPDAAAPRKQAKIKFT